MRNKRGIVHIAGCIIYIVGFISTAAIHHKVTTGKNIFKAKARTVDTVANPAPAHWEK